MVTTRLELTIGRHFEIRSASRSWVSNICTAHAERVEFPAWGVLGVIEN